MSISKSEKLTLHYLGKAHGIASDEHLRGLRTKLGFEGALNNVRGMYEEDVNALCDHIEDQDKEIERLREALRFYADEDNYMDADPNVSSGGPTLFEDEGGAIAREALEVSTRTESSEEKP